MYRLVIFDLDGTLLNTIGDLAAAGNHTLETLGYPTHSEDEYKLFVGNGIPKLIERMLPDFCDENQRKTALEIFGEYYAEHKSDRTVPYNGIVKLLTELRERGIIAVWRQYTRGCRRGAWVPDKARPLGRGVSYQEIRRRKERGFVCRRQRR